MVILEYINGVRFHERQIYLSKSVQCLNPNRRSISGLEPERPITVFTVLIIFGASRVGKEIKFIPSLLASTVNFFLIFLVFVFFLFSLLHFLAEETQACGTRCFLCVPAFEKRRKYMQKFVDALK